MPVLPFSYTACNKPSGTWTEELNTRFQARHSLFGAFAFGDLSNSTIFTHLSLFNFTFVPLKINFVVSNGLPSQIQFSMRAHPLLPPRGILASNSLGLSCILELPMSRDFKLTLHAASLVSQNTGCPHTFYTLF